MQVAGCQQCKMYFGSTYVPPSPVCDIQDAELIVIVDGPSKFDARYQQYLSKESGAWLSALTAPYVHPSKVYVTSMVRCWQHKKNAKTPEATKCYTQFLKTYIDWIRFDSGRPKRLLLIGFWPPKLLLGHDLKELGGQTITDGHVRYGVVTNPMHFIAKHVRWTKDQYGNWQCPEGSQERAKTEWHVQAVPVIEQLFSASKTSIEVGAQHKFPFTRVDEPEVLVRMLEERKGKLVGHDVETRLSDEVQAEVDAAKAANKGKKSRFKDEVESKSALDWFYGADHCMVRSSSWAFFDGYEDLGYTPGTTRMDYDPRKLVVYTGKYVQDMAKALHETKNVMFHASYDSGVLYAHTGELIPIHADPCDMGYVVDQGRKNYRLKSLCYEWIPEFATYADEMMAKKNYATESLPKLWNYNAGDSWMMMILYWKFAKRIADMNMNFLYWDIMAPVKSYLRDMEAGGVMLHRQNFAAVAKKTYEEEALARNELYNDAIVGWWQNTNQAEFNPNSPQQLMDCFAKMYGPGVVKSTGKKVLESVLRVQKTRGRPEDPFIKKLLRFRKVEKTRSTYVDGISAKVHKGVLYPSFKINTTETGRTSSGGGDAVGLGRTNQINIQNITRDSGLRGMFCARPNHYLAYADYGQIEVRVSGAYARSPEIEAICLSGKDFHGMTTAMAYNLDYDWVMNEDAEFKKTGGTSFRQKGKTTAFGMLYGMQAAGLAEQLNLRRPDGSLDVDAAQALIDSYFAGMPSIKLFIDETHEFVKSQFYVETVFGRRRFFDSSFASSLREGVNTKVQSAASDIFLMSLITTGEEFKKKRMYNRYVFPWAEVHDSITWEVHNSVPQDEIQGMMSECMVHGVRRRFPRVDDFMGNIPLAVDFKFDSLWH